MKKLLALFMSLCLFTSMLPMDVLAEESEIPAEIPVEEPAPVQKPAPEPVPEPAPQPEPQPAPVEEAPVVVPAQEETPVVDALAEGGPGGY